MRVVTVLVEDMLHNDARRRRAGRGAGNTDARRRRAGRGRSNNDARRHRVGRGEDATMRRVLYRHAQQEGYPVLHTVLPTMGAGQSPCVYRPPCYPGCTSVLPCSCSCTRTR